MSSTAYGKLIRTLAWLLLPAVCFGFTSYNYFAPGGALSCTNPCTAQSVNLGAGAFITGLLPNANLANASITLNGNVIALGASDVLALASADFANQGTTSTVLHGNAAGNPSFALINLASEVTGNLSVNNLNSGTGANAATYWSGAGTWTTPPGTTAGANPTALVGLSAVNGAAGTYLRSDGAPALDQSIVPTMTGATWTWSTAEPRWLLNETDQGADLKLWDFDLQAKVLRGRTRTDADGAGVDWLAVTRGTTTAITNITFGNTTNNPSYSFNGSGTLTINGNATVNGNQFTAGRVVINSATLPANGIYLSAANTIGFSANTTNVGAWNTTSLTLQGALNAPNLATSSAATSGTLCWTTGTGLVNVDTTTTCLLSSARYKENIQDLDSGLGEVMKFRPVSYTLRPEFDPTQIGSQVGLVAEDVAEIDTRLVSRESDGSPHAVRYQQLTALLIKAIQEQQRQLDALQSQVNSLHRTH